MASAWVTSDVKKWSRVMKSLGYAAFPETVAQTLNQSAAQLVHDGKGNMRDRMIIRTTYTTNGVRQDRHAKGRNIDRMYSRAAVKNSYLPVQNIGETVFAKSSKVPVPTIAARAGNLKRKIVPRYNMRSLGALKNSQKFFMGKPKGGNRPVGIWERHGNNKRLRLIRRLTVSSVNVPSTLWYYDAERENVSDSKMSRRFVNLAKINFYKALQGTR